MRQPLSPIGPVSACLFFLLGSQVDISPHDRGISIKALAMLPTCPDGDKFPTVPLALAPRPY